MVDKEETAKYTSAQCCKTNSDVDHRTSPQSMMPIHLDVKFLKSGNPFFTLSPHFRIQFTVRPHDTRNCAHKFIIHYINLCPNANCS